MSYSAPAIEHKLDLTAELVAVRFSVKKKSPE